MQRCPEECQSCVAGLHRMQWSVLSSPIPVSRTIHNVLYWMLWNVLNALKCVEYITGIGPCACITEYDQPCIPCMQCSTLLVLCFLAAVQSIASLVSLVCSTIHCWPCAVFAGPYNAGLVLCVCNTFSSQPDTQCMQYNAWLASYWVHADAQRQGR